MELLLAHPYAMLPGVVAEPSDEPEYVMVATLMLPPAVVGVELPLA